ncbi:MAG: Maf family protein [Planctomycetota bacterium]|jgi:septum formation protein
MAEQTNVPIILASRSPRRKQLLAEAGYEFTTVWPDIDESAFVDEAKNPCECAERLALAKAKAVAERNPQCLVLGADTVADFEGEIIGKPADAKEAEEITRMLFSGPHEVITAVAIVQESRGTEIVESDSTTVYPKKLTESQIAEHIKGGSWRGKAGAYAIQEGGDEFVERIEGSLTNVMGLPMELVQRLLEGLAG